MKHIKTFENFLNEASIVPGLGGVKHREGDEFEVVKDFNPYNKFHLTAYTFRGGRKTENFLVPIGSTIKFDSEADNGWVWFKFNRPDTGQEERGYVATGSLANMLTKGYIKVKK